MENFIIFITHERDYRACCLPIYFFQNEKWQFQRLTRRQEDEEEERRR